jgi:hypothetical protein
MPVLCSSPFACLIHPHFPTLLQVPLTACSQPVRVQNFHGVFSAIACMFMTSFDSLSHLGPISESDFFTWEALICGPKDTPFVRVLFLFFLLSF